MIIHTKQFRALAKNHYLEFENRTAAWLARHFPDDCTLLGPNLTRTRIRDAVQVGARYGFVSQCDTARFVYLWFLLDRILT